MRKFLCIVAAAAAMSAAVTASAEGFGVTGGFTSSNASVKNFDASSISQFHVGVTYQVKLPFNLSIQPSLLYQVKGAYVKDDITGTIGSLDTKVSYLEVPVAIQWGPDLLVARPYVFLEPFIGYGLGNKSEVSLLDAATSRKARNEWADAAVKRLEYGLGLGVGIEALSHLQLSAQYFWNFGSLANGEGSVEWADVAATYKTAYKSGNFHGLKVTATIFF